MIIVMKPGAPKEAVNNVVKTIENNGLTPHLSEGSQLTIIGVIGDKSRLNNRNLELAPYVDKIVPVTESTWAASRAMAGSGSSVRTIVGA